MHIFKRVIIIVVAGMLIAGCPLVRATGDTVEAAGDGVAYITDETGDAVNRAAHEIAPH